MAAIDRRIGHRGYTRSKPMAGKESVHFPVPWFQRESRRAWHSPDKLVAQPSRHISGRVYVAATIGADELAPNTDQRVELEKEREGERETTVGTERQREFTAGWERRLDNDCLSRQAPSVFFQRLLSLETTEASLAAMPWNWRLARALVDQIAGNRLESESAGCRETISPGAMEAETRISEQGNGREEEE